ncbi:hypothetical protein OS493_010991 [Desmophyllum pertusum]|uniref:Uncharacterized protein n=1 Tax=Desmophyllum pertusum TaxID=174260 RepID=A0A9W9ZFA9_9CNID|nr:hypothetical protein OS493_010991 [Desmophyllum pertusum]
MRKRALPLRKQGKNPTIVSKIRVTFKVKLFDLGNSVVKALSRQMIVIVITKNSNYPLIQKRLWDKESNEVIEDVKCDGLREELKVSLSDKGSLVYDKVSGNLEENMFEVSQSVADSDVLQPSGVCIYQLGMLSSPEEAKQAITDILKADPRSVYRRNRCQDQLYRFSIDTMNVTCKFEESTVEVLRVEPVFYRKLKRVPQATQ